MLLQNYTERGVISEYLNIDYIFDPQFVKALLKEKNYKTSMICNNYVTYSF